MEFKTDKPILVTGATGYISSYIIQILLKKGFKVRGSIRSLENKEKYVYLQKLEGNQNLSFVEASLENQQQWDAAVQGCDYVIHVASPIPPYIPKDQNQIIKPAVQGAINVLNASIKNNVKRFVFTSSCLTLYFGNENELLNQNHWADPTKCAHYPKSKILAERAVWEIYNKQNLKQPHTEVVSVLPGLVLGPGLSNHNNSSQALIVQTMKGNFPGVPDPDIMYSIVDVRDTAQCHYLALINPNLDGQRIASVSGKIFMSQILTLLNKQYPQSKINLNKITKQQMIASNIPIALRNVPFMGRKFQVNNQKSIQKLGISYIDVKQTILDMGKQLRALKLA